MTVNFRITRSESGVTKPKDYSDYVLGDLEENESGKRKFDAEEGARKVAKQAFSLLEFRAQTMEAHQREVEEFLKLKKDSTSWTVDQQMSIKKRSSQIASVVKDCKLKRHKELNKITKKLEAYNYSYKRKGRELSDRRKKDLIHPNPSIRQEFVRLEKAKYIKQIELAWQINSALAEEQKQRVQDSERVYYSSMKEVTSELKELNQVMRSFVLTSSSKDKAIEDGERFKYVFGD